MTDKPAGATAEFLRKAAAPEGFNRYSCESITPTQTTQIDWATASLIIWQAPLPIGAVASQLNDFVQSGGSALFFPPEKPGEGALFGTSWGEVEEAPDGKFFING